MQALLIHIVFYLFAAVLLLSSLMVTLTARSVHAVLWLIVAFVATAGLWILIEAEFLGLMLIIVYVGAVMTLFLFVVMMLNSETENTKKPIIPTWLSFGFIFFLMASCLVVLFFLPHSLNDSIAVPAHALPNLTQLGIAMFSHEGFDVQLVAVVLLASMVGVLYLTHRSHTYRKKQNVAAQQQVSKKDRLKVVSGE